MAQTLLLIKGCEASFVIAKVDKKDKPTAMSARSDGQKNVQKIVERLKGGGHFTAAALERNDIEPNELKNELIKILEEEEHESNLA